MKKNYLKDYVKNPAFTLEEVLEKEVEIYTISMDCSTLIAPDSTKKFHEYEPSMDTLMQALMHEKFGAPCLYWFTVENSERAKQMIVKLNEFRESQKLLDKQYKRVVPASNSNKIGPNINEHVIYVGKRHGGVRRDKFTNIAGRISIHFGYYKVGTTQGLQLFHWANETVKLNVMILPNEAKDYLDLLEKLLANKLKPLCGKH
jgi:hypothetical protein